MTRCFIIVLLATTMLGGAVVSPAGAQPTPAQPTQLDAVTSAATRNKRPIDAVPGTVSVITDQEIDRDNRTTVRNLVRDEPGVTVGNQPNRGGLTNFVIRGVGGNRVLVIVDGLRVPEMPGTNTGGGNYTRDFVDIESMKRVEIVRGPASALYGSDAIGGVIAFTTKDPSDYLVGDSNTFGSVKVGYSTADYGIYETLTGVIKLSWVEILALYTRRDFHETQLASSSIYAANPQNNFENNFLTKLVFRPSESDTIRVIAEYVDKIVKTHVLSSLGTYPSLVTNVYDEWAHDRSQRYRLSAQWEHTAPFGFVDRFDLMVYYSAINRSEDAMTLRGPVNGTIPTNFRVAHSVSTQDIIGLELQAETRARLFDAVNTFTYGLSFNYTMTARSRNRVAVTMATGFTNQTSGGETFPNKNFPDTDTIQAGLYLQDEIVAGPWTITPGVRLDYYSLSPDPDAMFWRSNGAINLLPTASRYLSVSPKLGAIYRFTDEYSAFAQYARGFRAPPYDNANFGFTNTTSFYQIIPNPNLVPETADSFEIGVRGKYRSGSSFALAAFYNIFTNFIDTVTIAEPAPPGITIFQFQNRPAVNIWGFEARGEYRFLPEWALLGYFAFAKGTDERTGQPIDSVDPWKAQARIRYGMETGLGAQIIGTVVGHHDAVSRPTAAGAQPFFQAPSHFNLDATISYNWTPHFKLSAGAFNITDARYWNSQDVIGVAWNSTSLDRLTQPGRYYGVNLVAKW
jgi:hemoglobin/transferrin/lactoferrin receptor protein